MTDNNKQYVTIGKLVSGLAIVLVSLMGWLFNIISDNTRIMQNRQSEASVRSAINQTRIDRLDSVDNSSSGRLTSLEIQSVKNATEISDIKQDIMQLNKYE